MTMEDSQVLQSRLASGEQIAEKLRLLHLALPYSVKVGDDVFPWAESFALAFNHVGVFPRLEAAKALVDLALAADETMPIVCPYDSEMKGALSSAERAEMFDYIATRIGNNRSPQSFSAAAELADFLTDIEAGRS